MKVGTDLEFMLSKSTFIDINGDTINYEVEGIKDDGSVTKIPSWLRFS